MADESLAWYLYPEPGGTSYSVQALRRPETVEEVFDYIAIGLAVISKEGCRFLVNEYGDEGLQALGVRIGWLDEDSAAERLRYFFQIFGYDIDADQFGQFDEDEGTFHPDPDF